MEGIKNRLITSEHVEEVYHERLAICNACNMVDTVGQNCAIPGTKPCCSVCGCSLSLKLRSLASNCPENKWLAVLDEKEATALDKELNPEKYDNGELH